MRPRKTILLAGEDDERVALLSYMLRIHRFEVIPVVRAAQGLKVIFRAPIDLLLLACPFKDAPVLLSKAHDLKISTLLVTYDDYTVASDWMADAIICRGECSNANILDRVKFLSARKRGPHAGL